MGIVISKESYADAEFKAKMKGEDVTGRATNKRGEYVVFTKPKATKVI